MGQVVSGGADNLAVPPQPQANLPIQIPFGPGSIDERSGAAVYTHVGEPEGNRTSTVPGEGEVGAQNCETVASAFVHQSERRQP